MATNNNSNNNKRAGTNKRSRPGDQQQNQQQEQQEQQEQQAAPMMDVGAMMAAMMAAGPAPAIPTAAPTDRRVDRAGIPVWTADPATVAACESAGWGAPIHRFGGYSPRDTSALERPIPAGISHSAKRGKQQQHHLLWFAHGLSGAIPALSDGAVIPLALFAGFIAQNVEVFAPVARFRTAEGALNALADYCGRCVVREGTVIRLTADNNKRGR